MKHAFQFGEIKLTVEFPDEFIESFEGAYDSIPGLDLGLDIHPKTEAVHRAALDALGGLKAVKIDPTKDWLTVDTQHEGLKGQVSLWVPSERREERPRGNAYLRALSDEKLKLEGQPA